MIIGVLKEIKAEEKRVAMTPAGVEELKSRGHTVLIEKGAGIGSGFSDGSYIKAGGKIIAGPSDLYKTAEMILHVKEPQPSEYRFIRKNQILFTFFHFAASEELTRALIKSESICIAYETIQKENGTLPILTPMSEIAGRMSILQGAKCLETTRGGEGVLLGSVPGVVPGVVAIMGGGVAGTNAAKSACGLGARVYILEKSVERLRYLDDIMPANCFLVTSSAAAVREIIKEADLVVGAALVPGAKAPRLITRNMLKIMKKGSVMVDISIDQGGCFETSKPTTHSDPTYIIDGVVHYCVNNMPGVVPKTSTPALTNVTIPYIIAIADKGIEHAVRHNAEIRSGFNMINGKVTNGGVAKAFDLEFVSPADSFDKNRKIKTQS